MNKKLSKNAMLLLAFGTNVGVFSAIQSNYAAAVPGGNTGNQTSTSTANLSPTDVVTDQFTNMVNTKTTTVTQAGRQGIIVKKSEAGDFNATLQQKASISVTVTVTDSANPNANYATTGASENITFMSQIDGTRTGLQPIQYKATNFPEKTWTLYVMVVSDQAQVTPNRGYALEFANPNAVISQTQARKIMNDSDITKIHQPKVMNSLGNQEEAVITSNAMTAGTITNIKKGIIGLYDISYQANVAITRVTPPTQTQPVTFSRAVQLNVMSDADYAALQGQAQKPTTPNAQTPTTKPGQTATAKPTTKPIAQAGTQMMDPAQPSAAKTAQRAGVQTATSTEIATTGAVLAVASAGLLVNRRLKK